MSVTSRAVKNVFRKKVRSISVIIIIGFCLAIFITMSIVNANISERANRLSTNVDTTVEIRPAGSYGGFSRGTMSESILPTVKSTAHVIATQKVITHMEGEMGDPGSGKRPTMVQGEDPSAGLILMGGGTLTINSGRTLNSGDSSSLVAIIGTKYAEDQNVDVSDTIDLNETALTVVGIFTTGNQFGDNGIIIPFETAKKVYAITGMNNVYVTVDYAGYVDDVVNTLKKSLGDGYDVVSMSEMAARMQESINSISTNSETGLWLSLITGVVVMIFVMIMVTRERTKEIGVLKAIGFKNSSIVTQFFIESIVLAVVGFVIGLILVMTVGSSLSNIVLGTSSGRGMPGGGFGGGIEFTLSTISPELLMYALSLAIAFGIIGSLYPILKAVSLKPAEALRYE